MSSGVTIDKQLDVLFETGSELLHEFATYRSELQEREKNAKQEGEKEKPETEREAQERGVKNTDFDIRYQRWYSICLSLMKRYAPDRLAEFESYYRPDRKRDFVDGTNYVIEDWFRCRGYDSVSDHEPWAAVGYCFKNQLAILKATRDRLEWQAMSTEDELERVLQLDLLESARGLSDVSERAAGALAGTVLDAWLRRLAVKYQVRLLKQAPSTGEYVEAFKAAKVLDISITSQLTWLAEIHARSRIKGDAPTKLQVRDLIDGSRWLLTNVF